jgi:hypothetical protein
VQVLRQVLVVLVIWLLSFVSPITLCACSVLSLRLNGQPKPANLSVYWSSVGNQQVALCRYDFVYSLWSCIYLLYRQSVLRLNTL